ncbi:MAG: S24/S26 family peptidase [Acutalibacteraceae bacterium]|nr:S24/S26 family peptidase [Acutalibacteraceae bacterium]
MENFSKRVFSTGELLPVIEKTVSENGTFPLTVTGTSMTPTLYSNRDIVHLVSTAVKPYKKYDIVLFKRNNGTVVLHRIIKILDDNMLLINGDSQTWTEEINDTQIIAVVKSFKRKGRLVDCDNLLYRIRMSLWCKARRIRPFLFKVSRLVKSK